MTPLEALCLVIALSLPFYWLVWREIERQSDPAYLRDRGVVIVLEKALDAHSEPIGQFMDHPIWATVTFKGMVYRFDRVIPARHRERIGPHELFLEPGLVYRTG